MVFKDLSKKTSSKKTALSLRPIFCSFRTAMANDGIELIKDNKAAAWITRRTPDLPMTRRRKWGIQPMLSIRSVDSRMTLFPKIVALMLVFRYSMTPSSCVEKSISRVDFKTPGMV